MCNASNKLYIPAFFSWIVSSCQGTLIRSRRAIQSSACSWTGMPSHRFSILFKVGFEIAVVAARSCWAGAAAARTTSLVAGARIIVARFDAVFRVGAGKEREREGEWRCGFRFVREWIRYLFPSSRWGWKMGVWTRNKKKISMRYFVTEAESKGLGCLLWKIWYTEDLQGKTGRGRTCSEKLERRVSQTSKKYHHTIASALEGKCGNSQFRGKSRASIISPTSIPELH